MDYRKKVNGRFKQSSHPLLDEDDLLDEAINPHDGIAEDEGTVRSSNQRVEDINKHQTSEHEVKHHFPFVGK